MKQKFGDSLFMTVPGFVFKGIISRKGIGNE